MVGGPVNGSYLYGLDNDSTGVIIPTVLRMTKEALSLYSNITCLYDRYHQPDSEKATLPICVFHVKKITPVRSVETSKKRVILYESAQPDGQEMADSECMRPGVMRTIVDNAVKQPVTYNMDIIVPFQPAGHFGKGGVRFTVDMLTGLTEFMGQNEGLDIIKSVNAYAFTVLGALERATELAQLASDSNGVSYLNMNSLEAMADSCRVLCMKMWTGYDYKFVLITGMTYEKNPLEDDTFRASLTLQEVPVLVVTRPKTSRTPPNNRHIITEAQDWLIEPLIKNTYVEEAASGTSKRHFGILTPRENLDRKGNVIK